MNIRYINAAVFMIWSLTYHTIRNSRHIHIEKDTTGCTTDLQKTKFTNVYQMDHLWWELCNREHGESLTNAKSEGAVIDV
jgi:hypothetical protein